MTDTDLDHDFRPKYRLYRMFRGLPWTVGAWLNNESGQRIDLTGYTIDSSFEADDGTVATLETSLSTTDPTMLYYGQSSPQVSGQWVVTLAAPGGPPTAYYAGSVVVYDKP